MPKEVKLLGSQNALLDMVLGNHAQYLRSIAILFAQDLKLPEGTEIDIQDMIQTRSIRYSEEEGNEKVACPVAVPE